MTLGISTSSLREFLNEVMLPQQSFAAILHHVRQNPDGGELEIEHVGHVLHALNTFLGIRLREFASCVENNFGDVFVDRFGGPDHKLNVGSVYQKPPAKGPSVYPPPPAKGPVEKPRVMPGVELF